VKFIIGNWRGFYRNAMIWCFDDKSTDADQEYSKSKDDPIALVSNKNEYFSVCLPV